MLEKLTEMIREQLNTDAAITEDTSFKDDLGADSLDLFELIMGLEEEFGVEIPTDDLENIATVGDVIKYLKEHGADEQNTWRGIFEPSVNHTCALNEVFHEFSAAGKSNRQIDNALTTKAGAYIMKGKK